MSPCLFTDRASGLQSGGISDGLRQFQNDQSWTTIRTGRHSVILSCSWKVSFKKFIHILKRLSGFIFSPCAVGCLWSVTAPDIDRYTTELLELWLNAKASSAQATSTKKENSEIRSLLCAVAKAKSACKLPLLTGGGIVSYGLPIYCDEP